MPDIPRRCAKGRNLCRQWQPCPVHGTNNWKNSTSPPLPGNWTAVRKRLLKDASCAYCRSRRDLEIDHILSRSKGGGDSMENLQVLCHPCHTLKTQKDRQSHRRK